MQINILCTKSKEIATHISCRFALLITNDRINMLFVSLRVRFSFLKSGTLSYLYKVYGCNEAVRFATVPMKFPYSAKGKCGIEDSEVLV